MRKSAKRRSFLSVVAERQLVGDSRGQNLGTLRWIVALVKTVAIPKCSQAVMRVVLSSSVAHLYTAFIEMSVETDKREVQQLASSDIKSSA